MTVRKHNGKTVFALHTKHTLDDNVIDDLNELCKMVDKRDVIIHSAHEELLKRGCRISELQQKCEQFEYNYSLSRLDAINQTTAFEKVLECGRIEKRELQEVCDDYASRLNRSESSLANSKSQFSDVIKAKDRELVKLTEELECIRRAKDKTDAENTRLWALDKNAMHAKYERLHTHHIYEVGILNETIDRQCTRVRNLETLCAEQDRHIKMLGSVEFEAVDDGVHITYTVG